MPPVLLPIAPLVLGLATVATVVAPLEPGRRPETSTAQEDARPPGQGSGAPELGAPAPPLEIAPQDWWIEPSGVPEGSTPIRVVHFWQPGPEAERVLLRYSALAREFAADGVQVIGLAVPCERFDRAAARAWVDERSAHLDHALAWDADGRRAAHWLAEHGARGEPMAFVVDPDGRLVFRGHPRWLGAPLEGLVAGDWDVERDNAELERAEAEYARIYRASGGRPDRVVALCVDFHAAHPRVGHVVDGLEFEALLELDRGREAAGVGRRILDRALARRDAVVLNDLAWAIVDPMRRASYRDLDLALEAAREANRLTANGDAYVLDTLARVHARRGDLERAIELQERAVALLDEPLLRQALEEYRRRLRGGR